MDGHGHHIDWPELLYAVATAVAAALATWKRMGDGDGEGELEHAPTSPPAPGAAPPGAGGI